MSNTNNGSKKRKVANFIKDGMESNDIKNLVQEVMLYMTEKKNSFSSHEELLNSMKSSIEGLLFFEERYPMLYAMVTKEEIKLLKLNYLSKMLLKRLVRFGLRNITKILKTSNKIFLFL